MKKIIVAAILLLSTVAHGNQGWLVKFKNSQVMSQFNQQMQYSGIQMKNLNLNNWVKLDITDEQAELLKQNSDILAIEKNRIYTTQRYINHQDPVLQQLRQMAARDARLFATPAGVDNPDIPLQRVGGSGPDPQARNQWGMIDNDVEGAWATSGTKGSEQVIVAVIDTGVDYTHEDLVDNMWRNPGETGLDSNGRLKATNGIDDDGNGYIDDVVGWDFAVPNGGDNKPFDLYASGIFEILGGGNAGHGTHCAGNIAARGDNGKGIAGVAPNVKIMAMRFLTESGQGTTEGAIQSIRYAVDNGAQILSNSWGSRGDGDPNNPDDQRASQALKDAIQYAMDRGVLFVAAAGNGNEMGQGYDNDTAPDPAFPASYDFDNIISVAALDENDGRGTFSNWGKRTVDIGAPGVKVFSTVPGDRYQGQVIPFLVGWDGTSMATPHVAGAAALYLSRYPNADWREMKEAILRTATPISSMQGQVVSDGKLNVRGLMQ